MDFTQTTAVKPNQNTKIMNGPIEALTDADLCL
jgi:hypothetical protein